MNFIRFIALVFALISPIFGVIQTTIKDTSNPLPTYSGTGWTLQGTTGNLGNGTDTQKLQYFVSGRIANPSDNVTINNWGFSNLATDTIVGIQVEMTVTCDGSPASDSTVQLKINNLQSPQNKANLVAWSTTPKLCKFILLLMFSYLWWIKR
jgi:hypothetical protein